MPQTPDDRVESLARLIHAYRHPLGYGHTCDTCRAQAHHTATARPTLANQPCWWCDDPAGAPEADCPTAWRHRPRPTGRLSWRWAVLAAAAALFVGIARLLGVAKDGAR